MAMLTAGLWTLSAFLVCGLAAKRQKVDVRNLFCAWQPHLVSGTDTRVLRGLAITILGKTLPLNELLNNEAKTFESKIYKIQLFLNYL